VSPSWVFHDSLIHTPELATATALFPDKLTFWEVLCPSCAVRTVVEQWKLVELTCQLIRHTNGCQEFAISFKHETSGQPIELNLIKGKIPLF
jgi:hypothetical protein